MKRLVPLVLSMLVMLAGPASAAGEEPTVNVGSKAFTESVILGEIAEQLVDQAGADAEHRRELGGTRVLWNALLRGDVDVYPEYTGTITGELFADQDISGRDAIAEALAERGVEMSAPLGFDNTYALGMKRERAESLGIETVADLREHPELPLAFSNEFMDRADGWPGLRAAYRLPFDDVRGLEHNLAYQGLESGSIAVTDLYSTDAEIAYYDLRVLEDSRDYFPEYQAVFLYRSDLREHAPEAVAALRRLEGRLDAARMQQLNKRVKIDERAESEVAARFLEDELSLEVSGDASERAMWERLGQRTLEHLFLVAVSMSAAIVIAIPLGILAARRRKLEQLVLSATGAMQTIPSLALLVFMIPLLGIGTWPAIAALFLYSLLPIVRNTHAGLTDIPDSTLESARALGLPSSAILRTVELPMATRAILAGIKTAVVINVGTATLGALIGAGGYGQPILTGIRLDDIGLILEGAVPAALLALAAQGFFDLVERWLVPEPLRQSDPLI